MNATATAPSLRELEPRGHLLLVSFHYLDGTSEGLCAARTANALADRGWRVTVVAGPARSDGEGPSALESSGSAVHVVRIETELRGLRTVWARLNRGAGRSLPARIVSAALNLAFGCSAEESAWIASAATRGLELVDGAEPSVDVVFSRLNPMVSHLAAERIVRARPGLSWTAYFSDPWPYFLYPPPYRSRAGRLYRLRSLGLARRVCARADSLLFPSRRLADALRSAYRISGDRLFVAPHMGPHPSGPVEIRADDRDQPTRDGRTVVLRHAGYLMKERRIDGLVGALLELEPAERSRIRVEFMGRRAAGVSVPAELDEIVTFLPPRPPEAARRWMGRADVALLVEADCEEGIFLPSKFAEYVVDGYPLLCLSPARGTIDDVLAQGGGLRVGPTDGPGIAGALRALLAAKRDDRLADFAPGDQLRRAFHPDVVALQVEAALVAARDRRRG